MAILKKEPKLGKMVIDISGPDGNAYALMAFAKNFSKQLGLEYGPIRAEMMSDDYEHLLLVFDKHFGHIVDLER